MNLNIRRVSLLTVILIFVFQNKNIAQKAERLPDLVFEKKVKGSTENEPIQLEIIVKNIGMVESASTKLTVDANYRCVTKADIKRLDLKLEETEFFYQMYRITRDIPALKPNETAVFNIKLEMRYTEDCGFYIQIDNENRIVESNERNNFDVFPEGNALEFNVAPDLIIKKIHEPDYRNDSTILTIEVENVGSAIAENVILNAWEIVSLLPNVSDRDLKALFGNRWRMLKGNENWEQSFDIFKKVGDMNAGEMVTVIVAFKGWIYNPDCRLGVEVKTSSQEIEEENNSSSLIQGG